MDTGQPERHSPDHSELVFALVAAVGTDVQKVVDVLATHLRSFDYGHSVIRLSDFLLEELPDARRPAFRDDALWESMSAGDDLRSRWEQGDALALHAISDIVATRAEMAEEQVEIAVGETQPAQLERHAFILRSLKTPDELETLRAVYGPRLVVIGAYSPRKARLKQLATEIKDSRREPDPTKWSHQPEDLIERDESEERTGGQDVSGTFHRADFFLDAQSPAAVEDGIKRTLAVLFGDAFRTPTKDETGQFHAAGAALRSAEFGRQVGAAIMDDHGSLLAVGTNEVPRHGGGSHWEEDGPGNRDFEIGDRDTNRAHLDELVSSLAAGVADALVSTTTEPGDAADGHPEIPDHLTEIRKQLGEALPEILRREGVKDLTEFGRAVHAEMNALLDAARRGVPIRGSTLYSTTFPCHNCARHLIGAGIDRVVFIEPYAKSRAVELHGDAIAMEQRSGSADKRVLFQPFVGVAPSRYLEMFDAAARKRLGHPGRKDDQGYRLPFLPSTALPVLADASPRTMRPVFAGYRTKELLALERFDELRAGETAPDSDELSE